ncbi:unnamed protein product [Heligmosomoides polygyrus]|uniref:Sushi domain-containing protein n=1 Tax=Heligmosomoides polygyrus TaxID=6339 RepID=A0A183GNC9_HELPZ|nr:unnamed protein product [Heligmosomoides polygyrus]
MHQHLIVLLALEVADFATPLCDPLRVEPPRSERPNITLTYDSTPDETNKYQNGTNVTFNCPPHYPIGVDKYGVCIDGEWKTLLVYGWDKTIPGFCQRKLPLFI